MEYRRKETKHSRYDHYPYFRDLKIDGGEETYLTEYKKFFMIIASLFTLAYYFSMYVYLEKTFPDNSLSYTLSFGTVVLAVLGIIAFGIYSLGKYLERRLGEEMAVIC